MKAVVFLIFSLACMLSCTRATRNNLFYEMDALCESNPDSAIKILEGKPCQTENERWTCALLRMKANLRKETTWTTNMDTVMGMIDYFKDCKDAYFLSDLYYNCAFSFDNLRDAPRATEYFQKSLDLLPKEGMEKKKAKCLYQIANMKIAQYIYDSSLEDLERAYKYSEESHDERWQCFILRDIAWCQDFLGRTKEALQTYEKGLAIARKCRDTTAIARLSTQYAVLLIKEKDFAKAEKALAFSASYDSTHHAVREWNALQSIYSMLYKATGRKEEEIRCYKELERNGTLEGKRIANYELANLYLESNQPLVALPYMKSFYALSDSLDKLSAAEAVTKINSLYNYQLRERENSLLEAENRRKTVLAWGLGAVCVIVALLASSVWMAMKKKRQELTFRNNALKLSMKKQEEESKRNIEGQRKAIEELKSQTSSLNTSNEELKKQLEKQAEALLLKEQRAMVEKKERDMALERVMASAPYKTLRKACQSKSEGVREQDEVWLRLEEEVYAAFPNMENTLMNLKKMSRQQLHVTLLIKLNFSPTDIATLTNKSRSAISSTRERLFKSNFDKECKAEDWDKFIYTL